MRLTGFLGGSSLIALLAVGIAGCSGSGYSPPVSEAEATLARNRTLWRSQGARDYRYRLGVGCFCTPDVTQPVIVEARNGATVSITRVADGQPAQADLFVTYDTIEDLFGVIQQALDQGADRLDVTYDPTFGYPTSIQIDYITQAADDELFLSVRDLQTL